jgi:phospholipase/lecithinase/hemolysin
MNKMDNKRSYFYTILLLCSLLLPNLANAAKPANSIVVFGDSLSDTGNKYFITGFAYTPPYSRLLDFFLAAAGAQHIVILNAPDLGATPTVKLADAEFSPIPGAVIAAATDFSQAYNFGLMANLAGV